jgi:drug/metabolite transporter (DMT)-like permease
MTGNLLAFAACCLIWSSTWLFIKVGLESIAPITSLVLRFLLSAPLLWLLARRAGEPAPRGAREWGLLAFQGLGMFAVPYFLVYWGEGRLPSGLTAVLFATNTVAVPVLAHFLLTHERFRTAQMVGILMGFAGVVVVCFSRLHGAADWLGGAAILGAALTQAYMSVFTRRRLEHHPPLTMLAWGNLFGGLMLVPFALLLEPHPIRRLDAMGVVALVYLAVFGTVIAFSCLFRLFKAWGATRPSTIALVTPPLALLWGWLFLHEPLDASFVLGGALVLVGVRLAVRPAPAQKAGPAGS